MRTYKKFTKDQRSTFPYWFWHWLAFNDVAREWGVWRFHHIFHDMENGQKTGYFLDQKYNRDNIKHYIENGKKVLSR